MNTEFEQDLPPVEEPEAAANVDAPPPDDAAHMDGFRAPEIDGEGEAAPDDVQPVGEDGEPIAPDPGLITKEQFWTVWQQVFGLPGLFAPRWKPLAIQPDEIETGRAASDAVYEIAEIYLPSILRPGGDMAARLLACVPFLLAKAQIARMILGEMKAERIAAQQEARRGQAATINRPPEAEAEPIFTSSRGQAGDDLRAMMDEGEAA